MSAVIFLVALVAASPAAARSGTTFTYQGQLQEQGAPYSGTVGMVLRLYDAQADGEQLGPDLNPSVEVVDGLFQVELDFGEQPWNRGLWLDITVDGIKLSARHPVTATPLASLALTAVRIGGDCPTLDPSDEMVRVGSVCIDRFEASIWDAPVGGSQITGAIPCQANGQDCKDKIYARSVAGVLPRRDITWFQAQAALANVGKRLPTNAEWQLASQGTPDHPGPCNTDTFTLRDTGNDPDCVSDWGVSDLVGNLWEWVADWTPRAPLTCGGEWPNGYGDDFQCLIGAQATGQPGALSRGGAFQSFAGSGVFAIAASLGPDFSGSTIGFRGAR